MEEQIPEIPTINPEPVKESKLLWFRAHRYWFYLPLIAIFGIAAALSYLYSVNNTPTDLPIVAHHQKSAKTNIADWKTYKNDNYGFEFRYPSEWNFSALQLDSDPIFVAYEGKVAPHNYYSNVTQVAVFPLGLGTEGPIGEDNPLKEQLTQEPEINSRELMLTNSKRAYGYFLRFANPPKSWSPSGFVWANSFVTDEVTSCGNEKKNMDECDPLEDGLHENGTIEPAKDLLINEILSTFRFSQPKRNVSLKSSVVAGSYTTSATNNTTVTITDFAKCLHDKQATMYGASWCPHCQNEKNSFGSAWQYVPYVECVDNPDACSAAGVTGYPTWILKDGQKLFGEQNGDGFKKLSEATSCPAPVSK